MFHLIDFAAKVRWRKRFQHNPILVKIQDKLAVKDYAAQFGVKSAKVFYKTKNPEAIPFDSLPENCFIKANHGCGWNIMRLNGRFYHFKNGSSIVDETGRYREKELKEHEIIKAEVIGKCKKWLNSKYDVSEWAYSHIDPRIYVEELITQTDETDIFDYRFFTFNGKVACYGIGSPAMRKNMENVFFDASGIEIQLTRYAEKVPDSLPPKPDFLNQMIEAANKLGKGIDFVRIDFFCNDHDFYLAEMTVYPQSGDRNTPTSCPEFNHWLAGHWKMKNSDLLMAIIWRVYGSIKFWLEKRKLLSH